MYLCIGCKLHVGPEMKPSLFHSPNHVPYPPRDVLLSRHHVGYWKSSVCMWCVS